MYLSFVCGMKTEDTFLSAIATVAATYGCHKKFGFLEYTYGKLKILLNLLMLYCYFSGYELVSLVSIQEAHGVEEMLMTFQLM